MNSNGRKYYLIIDNEKYYLQRQQDYCPRGCYDEVAPGGRLEATIPYSLFDMPSELFNRPKKLVFPSVATQCSE